LSPDVPLRPAGRHFRRAGHRPLTLVLSLAAAIMVVLVALSLAVIRPERANGTGAGILSGTGPMGVIAGVGAGGEGGGIEGILSRVSGYRVGVAVADTAGGAVRTFGDEAAFAAASTAKLITAVAYFQSVEAGEARLDERLGSYTAAFQLEAMINNSNNDSWLLLMDRIGHRRLIQCAASIGVTYDPLDNRLTPEEMARVLTKLYSGELLNPVNTAQLLGYMRDTNNEELIPAAASGPGITVYHKYGQLGGSLHDAALLHHRGATYALVIFTEGLDTTDEAERTQLIRDLTRTVVESLFPAA
jgi:beta-lactamase class A